VSTEWDTKRNRTRERSEFRTGELMNLGGYPISENEGGWQRGGGSRVILKV